MGTLNLFSVFHGIAFNFYFESCQTCQEINTEDSLERQENYTIAHQWHLWLPQAGMQPSDSQNKHLSNKCQNSTPLASAPLIKTEMADGTSSILKTESVAQIILQENNNRETLV